MSRILVTGATGFIGKHLVPQLLDAGHEVLQANSGNGDVAVESTWRGFPDAQVVVHLAGKSFVPDSWLDPEAFLRCNVLGTTAALGYCRRQRARLVLLSSYLYGDPARLPIPEDAPLSAKNPYALSKKLAEEIARFYADSFDVEVTILRPFNVYGAGQADRFLIPAIIAQVKAGETVRVKDLEPRRDYVYVTDVVRAIAAALGERRQFGVYNVGSGVSSSVAEVIQTVQDVWGTTLPVVCETDRRVEEIMDTVADITAAKRALHWEPHFTLLEGIRDLYDGDKLTA